MQGLACPNCRTALSANRCHACDISFPNLDQVPFMWAEPGAALLDWRNRFNMTMADLESQTASSDPTRLPAATRPATRQRIEQLHAALCNHREELTSLLTPLKVGEALARETHLALATQLPGHHGVLSYSTQIFRDWCWGDEENEQVAAHLYEALDQHGNLHSKSSEGALRILVLGCGAGRLAYDIHRQFKDAKSWALDSNPLLCLLGQAMASGQKVGLTEFPLAPVQPQDVAISRELTAPATAQDLQFVCADATRPPFAANSFDLIVTPWLIDVIDVGLADLLTVINPLLDTGGVWLNHGSVAFNGGLPANRLDTAEVAAITEENGFTVAHRDNIALPYLQSPASRNHREEIVFTQLAIKTSDIKVKSRPPQHLPEWIVKANVPVPLSQAFQTQLTTVRIHAFIMGLIDGERDINAMAKILEEQRLMPAAQATQAIRGFLQKMHAEAAAAQGQKQ
ncbi:MAG: methyltransferase domain-containing protein [Pseudomonadota bacterium]